MAHQLKHEAAIATGSAQGTGRPVARLLATEGASDEARFIGAVGIPVAVGPSQLHHE